MFLSLKKTLVDDTGAPAKNGNYFLFHFKQVINLSTFKLRIVQDFVNITSYTLIKEFNSEDTRFIANSEQGLFVRLSYNGSTWIINSLNENELKESNTTILGSYSETATSIITLTPSTIKSFSKMSFTFECNIQNPGNVPQYLGNEFRLKRNGTTIRTISLTLLDNGGSYQVNMHHLDTYTAGDVITIEAEIIGTPSGTPSITPTNALLLCEAVN
jgi:hypothetical protein